MSTVMRSVVHLVLLFAAASLPGESPEPEEADVVMELRLALPDKGLWLERGYIDGVAFSESLADIEWLRFNPGRSRGIAGLETLTALQTLELVGNTLVDLKTINRLRELRELTLSYRGDHLDDLIGLDKLERLTLYDSTLAEWSAIGKLPALKGITLFNCAVDRHDIAGALPNLVSLSVSNAEEIEHSGCEPPPERPNGTPPGRVFVESGVFPAFNLPELTILEFIENNLADIDNIRSLRNLALLDLSTNNIADIGPLADLRHLHELLLNNNRIADIRPLAGLRLLSTVSIENNRLRDLDGLQRLDELTYASFRNNEIVDIPALDGLASLEELRLDGNRIADATVLSRLPKLRCLSIGDNRLPLSRLHPLLRLPLRFLFLGRQHDVVLPGLVGPLTVGEWYDIGDECRFDGQKTLFTLLTADGEMVDANDAYRIEDGRISFSRPGKYVIEMRNAAVYSHGHGLFRFAPFYLEPTFSRYESMRRVLSYQPYYPDYDGRDNPDRMYHPPAVVRTQVIEIGPTATK